MAVIVRHVPILLTLYNFKELPKNVWPKALDNLYFYLDKRWQHYEMMDLSHNYWFLPNGDVWGSKDD